MAVNYAQILVNLFNFINNEGKRDLDPDRYQLAFDTEGLGVSLEIRYLKTTPNPKKKLGKIGLSI